MSLHREPIRGNIRGPDKLDQNTHSVESSKPEIEQRFQVLDGQRSQKLAISRESAFYTLPPLLPPEGHTQNQELHTPYNSIGAQGTTSLASQLSFAMIPPNNIPFFQFQPEFTQEDIDAGVEAIVKPLIARAEKKVMNRLLSSNVREGLLDTMLQLIVVGDALLIFEDDFLFRTIRFDNWVIERYATGRWDNLIYREPINPSSIPPEWEDIIPEQEQPVGAPIEFAYTQVKKIQKKITDSPKYKVTTEFRGAVVSQVDIHKGSKYIVLQWKSLPGENYGSSFVQESIGDFRTAEGLSQSLVEGAAANSEFRWMVNPGGVTKIADIEDSINGAFIPGRAEDIVPLQLNNVIQLQTTLEALDRVKKDLARKFLLRSELQPQGERVTATQIRDLAQSLDSTGGGIFTTINRGFALPILDRTVALMNDKGIKDLLKRDDVTLHIKTGLETLNREIEHEKTLQMSQLLLNLPPTWMARLKEDPILRDMVAAFGKDPSIYVMDDAEFQKKVEDAQTNAIQQQADEQTIKSAGSIAEQGESTK